METFYKIYKVVKSIPAGKVATYGQVARASGTHPRVVGLAMNKNPHPVVVPCHRVVGWNGHLTGYAGGIEKKRKLLLGEGVKFRDERHVDLASSIWQGSSKPKILNSKQIQNNKSQIPK